VRRDSCQVLFVSRLGTRLRNLPWFEGLPREVAVLSAVAFCVALGFGILAPAIPVFAKTFDVTATQASAVISVFALMRLIGAVPAGWLVDRIGERSVLVTGLSIVAVSSALAGFSTSFNQLLGFRGIGGLGSAMFTVSAMALLLRSVGPEQRGRAAGAFQGGFLLGGVAGPAVGGLVTGISIRLPFFVYAATLGAAVLVVVTMMAHTHSTIRPRPADGRRCDTRSATVPTSLPSRSTSATDSRASACGRRSCRCSSCTPST
jgi:DHA1 family multidrug resistance protein-like MFS transporter